MRGRSARCGCDLVSESEVDMRCNWEVVWDRCVKPSEMLLDAYGSLGKARNAALKVSASHDCE